MGISMNMRKLADHIISVANQNGRSITNLQLQKILYFTLRNSVPIIGIDGAEKTYDEPFLVWKYGPVVKSQYDRFYSYGSSPIIEELPESEEYAGLNDLIIQFLDMDVFRMVNASHTHSFWKQNESSLVYGRSNIEYPLKEVLRKDEK